MPNTCFRNRALCQQDRGNGLGLPWGALGPGKLTFTLGSTDSLREESGTVREIEQIPGTLWELLGLSGKSLAFSEGLLIL